MKVKKQAKMRQKKGSGPICAQHPAGRSGKWGLTPFSAGLIRLHILHHACREAVFGLGMIEELARHGYRLSPGTVYPLLHGLELKGYLRSFARPGGTRPRRMYRGTAAGRKILAAAREKVRELFGELFEDD